MTAKKRIQFYRLQVLKKLTLFKNTTLNNKRTQKPLAS